MKEIYLIKDYSWEGELLAKGRERKCQSLFVRQGDLDGACAVYSLMMMLMLHKRVNRNELVDRKAAQDITGGGYNAYMRLQDKILGNLPGLYQDGYFFDELARILDECFKNKATASVVRIEGKRANSKAKLELVKTIMETIKAGYPVEIGFTRKTGGGHAVVAVGYTTYKTNVRLFCLDPGYDIGKTAFWNTIIDLSYFEPVSAIYSDKCYTPDGKMDVVTVDEILTIDEE